MDHTEATPMTFNNGLTSEHDDKRTSAIFRSSSIRLEIEELGRHRTYSLASFRACAIGTPGYRPRT